MLPGGEARIRTGVKALQASALPLGHFAPKKDRLNGPEMQWSGQRGSETRDPNLGKVVLYQLSHVRLRVINLRELSKRRKYFFFKKLVPLIINFIRTLPTFIRTCADECGNPIP